MPDAQSAGQDGVEMKSNAVTQGAVTDTKDVERGDSKVAPKNSATAFTDIAKKLRSDEEYELVFDDLRVRVDVPWYMPAFATRGTPGQTVHILNGVSGRVKSGSVFAIIGASGSGKTTLLDRLANMPTMDGGVNSGRVTVNGSPMTDEFFKSRCAYVTQDDRLMGALSVYENLDLAAQLYSPSETLAERKDRIEAVLAATGLQQCQGTKVGNALIKGVSGGQRRRVSIAVELMGNPRLLFLDEPTSGLDSKSAGEIMALLGEIARTLNVLIVCSIHQPSSRTFLAFDQTLLLSRGQVAYYGKAVDALAYFEKLGYKSPDRMNPADYLIEISNPDFTDKKKVQALLDAWSERPESKILEAKEGGSATDKSYRAYASSFFWQIWVLSKRNTLAYMRDPGAYIGRAVLYTIMSIIFGIIYMNTERNQEGALNYMFAVAWGVATPSYMAVMIMPVFSNEAATFAKEAKNGMYSPAAYVIAMALVQLPFVLITSTFSVIPYYWITDMNPSGERFVLFWLLTYTFLYTVESICAVSAAVIPNFVIALGSVVSLLSNFFVFNGLFVKPENVPWVFRWIEYISPHKYVTQGLAWLAFNDQDFTGYDGCSSGCYGRNGDQVLDNLQGLSSNTNVGLMFGILWIEAFVLRAAHWRVLNGMH